MNFSKLSKESSSFKEVVEVLVEVGTPQMHQVATDVLGLDQEQGSMVPALEQVLMVVMQAKIQTIVLGLEDNKLIQISQYQVI